MSSKTKINPDLTANATAAGPPKSEGERSEVADAGGPAAVAAVVPREVSGTEGRRLLATSASLMHAGMPSDPELGMLLDRSRSAAAVFHEVEGSVSAGSIGRAF